MERLHNLAKGEHGAEIAEAALVLPLVFMLLFGIIWFGLAFNVYSTVNAAAREGARFAARPQCAWCTPSGTTWNATNLPDDQAVENAVIAVLQSSRVDKTKIQLYQPPNMATATSCAAPAPVGGSLCSHNGTYNVTVCRSVLLNPNSTPQQCGIVVSFQYPFGAFLPFPSFPSLGRRQIIIAAEGESRMQN